MFFCFLFCVLCFDLVLSSVSPLYVCVGIISALWNVALVMKLKALNKIVRVCAIQVSLGVS